MKKLLLLVTSLLMISSVTFAQSGFQYSQLPQSLRDHLAEISKAAATMKLEQRASLNKGATKQIERSLSFEWDTAANNWHTDTSTTSTYVWNLDGTIKEVNADGVDAFSGEEFRYTMSQFVSVNSDFGDRFLEGYFPTLLEVQAVVFGNWAPVYRIKFSFDANGNMTQDLQQQIGFPSWTDVAKTDYTYGSHGNLILTENYFDDGSGLTQTDGTRYTFTYDGNFISSVEEEEYQGDSVGNYSWVYTSKEVYYLIQNGLIESAVTYWHDMNDWVAGDSIANIQWESFEIALNSDNADAFLTVGGDMFASFETYRTGSGGWELDGRSTKTYNANGMPVSELREAYFGQWMNETKSEWSYYTSGDMQVVAESYWDGAAWVEYSREEYTNTYDMDMDITSEIYVASNDGIPYSRLKQVYEYSPVTAIAPVKHSVSVNAYPNPVTDKINISLNEQVTAAAIVISDMTGRQVMRNDFSNVSQPIGIDASGLPAGQYILTVTTGAERHVQPIVKN